MLRGIDKGAGSALVVGLGNPGQRYRDTRHNSGLRTAAEIIGGSSLVSEGDWDEGHLALVKRGSRTFFVYKPGTFMNVSGRAILPILDYYGLAPDQMVVVHDDIDIPLGEVRVKEGGGTGGHRGLQSVVESLGSSDFHRVRIGVGRPPGGIDPAEYVLSDFEEEEREEAESSIVRAAGIVAGLVSGSSDPGLTGEG